MDYKLENEKILGAACVLYQITNIQVCFSGSGDSGQIDSVTFNSSMPGFEATNVILPFWVGRREFVQGVGWQDIEHKKEILSLYDLVEKHVTLLLDETGVDWYNNDGGQGFWSYDGKTVNFLIEVNYVQANTEHNEVRSLGQPKEEAA